jgi:hypothetical protein
MLILRYAQDIFSISLADTYSMPPVPENGKTSQVFFKLCGSTRPCPQNGGSRFYCIDLFHLCVNIHVNLRPRVLFWFIAYCDTYWSVNMICIFKLFFLFLIPKLNKNIFFLHIFCIYSARSDSQFSVNYESECVAGVCADTNSKAWLSGGDQPVFVVTVLNLGQVQFRHSSFALFYHRLTTQTAFTDHSSLASLFLGPTSLNAEAS